MLVESVTFPIVNPGLRFSKSNLFGFTELKRRTRSVI